MASEDLLEQKILEKQDPRLTCYWNKGVNELNSFGNLIGQNSHVPVFNNICVF